MPKSHTQKTFDGFEDESTSTNSDAEDLPMVSSCSPRLEGAIPTSLAPEPSAAANMAPALSPETEGEGNTISGLLKGKTVYVIDAHSLIFQVYHAMPEMTGPTGKPVNAIFGFLRDMLQLIRNQAPDFLYCAFDLPGPTFRHSLFPQYKADRAEMPDDLRPQIPEIKRLLDAMTIPVVALENYEADDVMATMAKQIERQGGHCVLVTNDKDCRQLITEHVRLFNIRKNEFMDRAALLSDWGIRPDQVVDYQALVGDPVDNVPGIPLIGPKLARQFIEQFGTLESILDHADEITGTKRRENLKSGRKQALISRDLVRLADDLPLQIPWERGRVGLENASQALALCQEFGFRSLADQVAKWAGNSSTPLANTDWETNYQSVTTVEQLRGLAMELNSAKQFALDTETTSLNARRAQLVGISVCTSPGKAAYIPVRAPQGEATLSLPTIIDHLKSVLENERIRKVGQNVKYDAIVLKSAGIDLRGIGFDSMIASFVIDSGARGHGLDHLAEQYFGHRNIKIKELIGEGRQQKRMDQVALAAITTYACEDADVALRLAEVMQPIIQEEGFEELFAGIEMPLVEVLVDMEFAGIRLDVELLKQLSQTYALRLAEYESKIYELAGHPFNIGSPRQLATVLFEELKLPVVKKTKTGYSTDVEVLEQLADLHELPRTVMAHRHLAKLKSTYIDALPTMVNPETERIHTSFNQVVAVTGRLSSADPNLQNIPIRSDEGREIRQAFVPQAGWQMVMADYSQVELRVLAHFSGDATLIESFRNNEDIHARVAAEVFHVPLKEVTADQRRRAKAVNFGVIYGQSAFGLAKALQISKEDATSFIDAYFDRYQGILDFMEQVLDDCNRDQFVTTMFGRRRRIEGVRPSHKRSARQRNLPERTAINSVIQGTAADLIKKAMISIHRGLRAESWESRMLLQIHDELLFEVPPHELDRLCDFVRIEMEGVAELKVPLDVDIQSGMSWADGKG